MNTSRDVNETVAYRDALADCGSKILIEEDVIKRARENIKLYVSIRDELKGEFNFKDGVFEYKGIRE